MTVIRSSVKPGREKLTMTTKLHFWDAGDPSVGINSNQAEIVLELEGSNTQETAENITRAKVVLSRALGEIWDNGPVRSMTEEELHLKYVEHCQVDGGD